VGRRADDDVADPELRRIGDLEWSSISGPAHAVMTTGAQIAMMIHLIELFTSMFLLLVAIRVTALRVPGRGLGRTPRIGDERRITHASTCSTPEATLPRRLSQIGDVVAVAKRAGSRSVAATERTIICLRRMQKSFVALLIVLAGSTGTARAEDKTAANKGAPPKVKVYDLPADTIEGKQIGPDGLLVDVHGTAKHPSLIRIRTNFIPELIKSAEEL